MTRILIAVALASLAARAGEGVEIGVRVGYAVPFGDAGSGVPFNTWVQRGVPFEVDLGYRFNSCVYAGVSGGYTLISRHYCETRDCSDHGFRVGGSVQIHPLGQVPVDPWFGIGFGYEWLSFSERFTSGNDDRMLEGFDLANLQIGIDLTAPPSVKLGPVLSLSIGTFRKETIPAAGPSFDVQESAHLWLALGFRVRFTP